MMKKYRIISANEARDLETEITKLINEGWQLAGGVSVAYQHEHAEGRHIPGHLVFSQALVKE